MEHPLFDRRGQGDDLEGGSGLVHVADGDVDVVNARFQGGGVLFWIKGGAIGHRQYIAVPWIYDNRRRPLSTVAFHRLITNPIPNNPDDPNQGVQYDPN